MRRVSIVDGMLLGTVLLWALNTTVSKYLLVHGWQPLSYGVIRYLAAIALFWAFTLVREGSLRIALRDWPLVGAAASLILVNQICFVYSVHFTTASTVALMFGTTPVFVGLLSIAVGLERLGRRFWAAAFVTFGGVALVALGNGGNLSGDTKGMALALGASVTWAGYSIVVGPLMQRYSPFRISSIVLALGWLPLAAIGSGQVADQRFSFGPLVWVGFAYAVVGPLFLTNILWFTAIDRVGAARASVFANLQPFFAVCFAVVLLSEHLHALEVAGGALIFAGILLERVRIPLTRAPETPVE